MPDEHDLIVAVKQLALELGTSPSVIQCTKHIRNYRDRVKLSNFKRHSAVIQEAGLVPNTGGKKIDNRIFERDIDRHLDDYIPKEVPKRVPYASIAVISDIHWPFCNKKVLSTFQEYVADVKPEYVFLNGDAWDMYSHSKFPRSHNVFTPKEEEQKSRQGNEEFWKIILKNSPKSKCVQMLGNHDVRPMRRVMEVYPEAEEWIKERMEKMFTFDGVKTIFDVREEYMIGDIAIFHGYRSKLGEHRDYTLYNTINGHTHVGGSVFRKIRGQVLWELNSGLAGDPEAKGLTYTPQKISNWTPGFGAVDKKGPRFIWV